MPCGTGQDGSRVRQQVGRVLLGHPKSTHRLTVQRVVGRTGGLGLLGDELSVDVLTGVKHTLVIRRHVGVVHLWKWTVKHVSGRVDSAKIKPRILWLPGNCKADLLSFQKMEGRKEQTWRMWVVLSGVVKMQLVCTHEPQQLSASLLYS